MWQEWHPACSQSRISSPQDLFFACKRSRPPSNLVNGQELTMCDIVWVSPQSHSSLLLKPHFLSHALQWPWPVRKRFSSDHWRLWRSKLRSWIVGSTTEVELTTVADCQSSLHRLVTSVDCKSLHSCLCDKKVIVKYKTNLFLNRSYPWNIFLTVSCCGKSRRCGTRCHRDCAV